MEKHVGFSGTRLGLTLEQLHALTGVLLALRKPGATNWIHHGDCLGADESVHKLGKNLNYNRHVHPPENPKARAYCQDGEEYSEPRTYRQRNTDIVEACEVLVVCPRTKGKFIGGTGMTYDIAGQLDKPRIIVYPDGEVIHEQT